MIKRTLHGRIKERLFSKKAIVLMGPRQTGKTTLLKQISIENDPGYLFLDCDDPKVREQLEDANTYELTQLTANNKIVFIDEAQRVKNIGLSLKIITDQIKNIQLLVSGSSALDLSDKIKESLTGRKKEYTLYPVSWEEIRSHFGVLDAQRQFEARIVFGTYPEVINNPGKEKEILSELSGSYLYKDILSTGGIRKPEILEKLLRALALQLGNEVSYNELSRMLEIDKNTVYKYIDLLEKAFVIFRLAPLSRNIRSEISSNRKIYFYDNGIRNAIISNFNPLSLRQDTGALWENFCIVEKKKHNEYNEIYCNTYFWRTHAQQEIDYVEESDGVFHAYEFKWNPKAKSAHIKTFANAYPGNTFEIITPQNINKFLKLESAV